MSHGTSEDFCAESVEPDLGVLIVDDDESDRKLLCLGLSDFGFKAWSASTGFEAVKLYPRLRERLSCVVLDLDMPGLDGADTLTRLRGLDPQARVYILTGHIDAYDEDELLRRGAIQVLYKPIPLSSLASTLRHPER